MSWSTRVDIDGFEFVLFSSDNGYHGAPVIAVENPEDLNKDGFLAAFKRAFELYPVYEADVELSSSLMYIGTLYNQEERVREFIQRFEDFGIEPSEAAARVIEHVIDYYENPKPREPKKKQGRTPVAGYVYLLQSPTGHYKIGCTSNPHNRAKTFGIQLPFEVEFLALIYFEDMYALEAEMHEEFAHKRVNGEWFALDDADVEYIKSMEIPA